jgi:hypothetical protein
VEVRFLFHYLFLIIFMLGLIAGIAALVCLLRARPFYMQPQGMTFMRRGFAKLSPGNYAAEGAALVRLSLFSLLLCAYAWIPGGIIHWTRFGSLW